MTAPLPPLPTSHSDFIPYLHKYPKTPLRDLVRPYKEYESKLREVFAQHRDDPQVQDPLVNVVPVFAGHEGTLKTRARDPTSDDSDDKYIMPIKPDERRADGSPATAGSLKEFRSNFNLFSEQSLSDLDWTNVIAAGSSVTTAMLPVPEQYSGTKRALREYYHQKLAPSSDVDLFLVGLEDEEAATRKVAQIEECIRNSVLAETTTIRTHNAITIASQYPTRHVQIVLRMYKSVSEVLTGFDIDSSCFAYDGKQVWATPRGITSFCSQINEVDLTRRSPSYETRLAKYAHRGFEVFFPDLDRSRIDPTIFERSFVRTLGLARLLILEKLPTESERDEYLNQRRKERGRPELDFFARRANRHELPGNKKDDDPEDIPDWEFDDAVANYHTFTVPYGPKYHAKKIERLLFTKDMLLNAEWNRSKDRKVNLHRHPCFLGDVASVIQDCCGECPQPSNDEEREVAEEEGRIYVTGKISYLKDDPGRQQIGSFNPLTEHDWTDMAYLGNAQILCEAIIDGDIDAVHAWLAQDGNDVNHRDHSGRMPLHFAIICGQLEIVKVLIEGGARISSRVADGFTSLHMAAAVGRADILKVIGEKSEANEALEAEKDSKKKAAAKNTEDVEMVDVTDIGDLEQKYKKQEADDSDAEDNGKDDEEEEDEDEEDSEDYENSGDEEDDEDMTQGSFVKVKLEEDTALEEDPFGPDFFDFNVLAWDSPISPLHVAIIAGHTDCIETLVSLFGADPLLPVKLASRYSDPSAVLPLVLGCRTPGPDSSKVLKKLIDLGSKPSSSDTNQVSALHAGALLRAVSALKIMIEHDAPSSQMALNFVRIVGFSHSSLANTPLISAIKTGDIELVNTLLDAGASSIIPYEDYCKAVVRHRDLNDSRRPEQKELREDYKAIDQPIIFAAQMDMPTVVKRLIETGADVNSVNVHGARVLANESSYEKGRSVLNFINIRVRELKQRVSNLTGVTPTDGWPNTNRRLIVDEFKPQPGWTNYQKAVAARDHEYAKSVSEYMSKIQEKARQDNQNRILDLKPHEMREKEDLEALLQDLEELQTHIKSKGGKTLSELRGKDNIKKMDVDEDDGERSSGRERFLDDSGKYEVEFTFEDSILSERKREAYLKLFSAVWDGDSDTVKALTLKPIDNGEGGTLPPLPITTKDSFKNQTLGIAIGRGHAELAKTIIDIAKAQYRSEDMQGKKKKQRRRYRIVRSDEVDDYDSESDPDAIPITSDVVDEEFTIDDLGKLSQIVGSNVPVEDFILRESLMILFMDQSTREPEKVDADTLGHIDEYKPINIAAKDSIVSRWNGGNLVDYAIEKNDFGLLKFLLSAARDARMLRKDLERPNDWTSFGGLSSDWRKAFANGQMDFVEEIIKTTGVDLPLIELLADAKISDDQEKSKYYQGLMIHGKRKADWAKQAAGDNGSEPYNELRWSPVLNADNLKTLKFWLGNDVVQWYTHFGETHQSDKRVSTLTQHSGGWQSVVTKWIGLRRHLGLHVNALRNCDEGDYLKVFEHFLEVQPDTIDKRSRSGYTPLWLAYARGNIQAARLLIERGANQTTRDKLGNNILHALLTHAESSLADQSSGVLGEQSDEGEEAREKRMEDMIKLIDPRLLTDLFTERSSVNVTGVTPFALMLHRGNLTAKSSTTRFFEKVLSKYLPEEVYTMYDGSGQTPAHTLVMQEHRPLLEAIIEARPNLLGLENGTGQTPFELAQARFLQEQSTQSLPDGQEHRWHANPNGKYRENVGLIPKESSENNKTLVYTLLRNLVRGNPQIKRKMISVNDAREVSRRLAERQRDTVPYRDYRYLHHRDPDEDEVDLLFSGRWVNSWY